ncbi:voltage-dependent T-type calcium channel subunit alpha-1H-like [Zophobas morio]|uniref:voltage-dependent T-type calcium channel subunit alpha-1H-like n=1 Tax=Zophobas morio TaxID=2755281 RepID=UPI0030837B31
MHYYPGTAYSHCRSGSDSGLHHRSYRRDPEPFDSGESTLSELDESESGSGSGIEVDPNLPYPGIAPIALRYLSQTTRPRSWCLALISNPYPLHMHTFFTCLQGKVGIVEAPSTLELAAAAVG